MYVIRAHFHVVFECRFYLHKLFRRTLLSTSARFACKSSRVLGYYPPRGNRAFDVLRAGFAELLYTVLLSNYNPF